MSQNPIDIIDIIDGNIMPSDRDYIFDINRDLSPETTGLIRVGDASITLTADTVEVAGTLSAADGIEGDTKGTHVGAVDLAGDQTLGFSAAGAGALLTLDVGAVGTPETSIGATGLRTTALTIGPDGDPSVAEIDATGAATLLSASIGTAGSEEVTIDSTGITAPGFSGPLTGDSDGTHVGPVELDEDADYTLTDEGVATLASVSVGTVGAPEVSIDSTGVTAPAFSGDLTGDSDGTHTGAVDLAGDSTVGFNVTGVGTLLSLSVGTVGTPEVSIDSTGITAPAFQGDLTGDVTGNADTADEADAMSGALVRGTAEYRPCVLYPANHTGSEWDVSTTCPGYTLPQNLSNKVLWAFCSEPEGRTITAWKVGGVYTETTGLTCTARLYKYTGSAGSITETAIGESVTLTEADGVLSGSHTLAVPYVIEAGVAVALKIIGTTQETDMIIIGCAHIAAK